MSAVSFSRSALRLPRSKVLSPPSYIRTESRTFSDAVVFKQYFTRRISRSTSFSSSSSSELSGTAAAQKCRDQSRGRCGSRKKCRDRSRKRGRDRRSTRGRDRSRKNCCDWSRFPYRRRQRQSRCDEKKKKRDPKKRYHVAKVEVRLKWTRWSRSIWLADDSATV